MAFGVIVFKTTYLTFKAERTLKKAGIPCKIVTKPRAIGSDCGLAVSIDRADETAATTLLEREGIEKLGVW